MNAATFFDGEEWREGVIDLTDGRLVLRDDPAPADAPRLDGLIVGGFTDHHVHLQLVDHTRLAGSTLGRVVDLGANPEVVAPLAVHNSSKNSPGAGSGTTSAPRTSVLEELRTPRPVQIDFAGAFLTPTGGYPSDRSWAPAGSFREIADAASAARAVAEMADAGASCIKVASNGSAGPVFDDALFRVIVELAAARDLDVTAHAEGRGEAQRVARLGARRLAHAPFTERLSDDEIAEQAASVAWISTLAIHGGADLTIALHNVRRFHAAGGTVLYGTDMGNGPTPVGVNGAELRALRDAGLDDASLLRALAPCDPRDPSTFLLLLPGATADPLLARPLTPADLKV
ncbi:amidohydrolase family protein [Microbacterium sp. SSW1-49]|uniref:Amidohydrolase family protein n=1 Tax=Microbacterium croceum TaxID=2851645 RepID=A0ABT0FIE5_9MICO|nr:amidohydrolase family protein [Microbacterium croceum]MCK2037835.1 amidohydrolase family protein [Microbacterium croceum]